MISGTVEDLKNPGQYYLTQLKALFFLLGQFGDPTIRKLEPLEILLYLQPRIHFSLINVSAQPIELQLRRW